MIECLSFHAGYRCAHSGACCRTGWDVPFTADERGRVERLQLVGRGFDAVSVGGISVAPHRPDGACVFLDEEARRCAVQRVGGHDALPLSCRMFPRVVRHDSIGTRLSLSHYCPTAAELLFTDGDVAIVPAPESLVSVGELDGLDAREALPPLLRRDVLMDVESYRVWETLGVRVLTMPDASPQEVLDRLAAVTRQATEWRPGAGSLLDAIECANSQLPTPNSQGAPQTDIAVKRWLSARLFGNWIAYQGRGLETIVRYLQACFDAFTVELARDGDPLEAIRRADYLIVHETDSQELADLLA